MKPTPSLVKRVLPQPAMHYQTWSWVTILASGLICGLVTWLHFSQIQLLSQTTDAITNMHVARLDLAKGFLYVTLADEAAAPYGREEGLALLQQATASLENITAGLEAGAGAANLAEFRRDLVVFQARLADLRVAAVATPALETEVRIAFHDLENQASELDRQAHHYLTELEGQFNLQFAWVLGGAVVLLAGISVMSVRAEQARHKATQALREREQSLRESQVNFATIFDRSPVAIGISRLQDGQITHLNTAFADLYGLEREEALGHTTAELDLWA